MRHSAHEREAKITWISAGAGSGKTYALTERITEALISGTTRPNAVFATTFTRKAADELRIRIRERLIERGYFILATEMESARIGTVHSLCGQLIERFAFEAGLSPTLRVLSEEDALLHLKTSLAQSELVDQFSHEWFARINRISKKDDWQSDLVKLIEILRSNVESPDAVKEFAQQSFDELKNFLDTPVHDENLTEQLLESLKAVQVAIEAAMTEQTPKNTQKYLGIVKAFIDAIEQKKWVWQDWLRIRTEAPQKDLVSLTEPLKSVADKIFAHPLFHDDLKGYITELFDHAAALMDVYQKHKRQMGVLDFVDQERLMLELLNRSDVQEALKDELDLLVVDEFQDTSPIQLALFMKLGALASSIYWVGDIKQSIFGFRGSDPELVQILVKQLDQQQSLRTEILNNSWRSRPGLVALVNQIFVPAFSDTISEDMVRLIPKREEQCTEPALMCWTLTGTRLESRALELAEGIGGLVQKPYTILDARTGQTRQVCWDDVVILVRKNDHINIVSQALLSQKIPVSIQQPGLLRTPELVLTLACFRRMTDIEDTLATAEIMSLGSCLSPDQWIPDRINDLEQGIDWTWGEENNPLLKLLGQLRQEHAFWSPSEAIQRLIMETELLKILMRWEVHSDQVRKRVMHVQQLVEWAKDYESQSLQNGVAVTARGFLIWLSELQQSGRDRMPAQTINAVQVMTHHAAKGLEWPVVVLWDLNTPIQSRLWGVSSGHHGSMDIENPLRGRYVRFWPWPFDPKSKPDWLKRVEQSEISRAIQNQSIEEEKRLLYVSMTRARDLMILALDKKWDQGWISLIQMPEVLPADINCVDVKLDGISLGVSTVRPLKMNTDHDQSVSETFYATPKSNESVVHLPLLISPSRVTSGDGVILSRDIIGEPIHINVSPYDDASLGEAIHACMARSVILGSPMHEAEIEATFARWNVAGILSAVQLKEQMKSLHSWIEKRWPDRIEIHSEVPIECPFDSGQVLRGRMDLIIRTPAGWIIVDHKSAQGDQKRLDTLALTYAPQLQTYAQALKQVTNLPVLESWVFFPVVAQAIQVEVP